MKPDTLIQQAYKELDLNCITNARSIYEAYKAAVRHSLLKKNLAFYSRSLVKAGMMDPVRSKEILETYKYQNAYLIASMREQIDYTDEYNSWTEDATETENHLYINENSILRFDKDNSSNVYTFEVEGALIDRNILDNIINSLEQTITPTVKREIYLLTGDSKGTFTLRKTNNSVVTDFIPENYVNQVVTDFNYIVENLKQEKPNGRLVLIDGPPGSGKTYFIRSLAKAVTNKFVFIPQSFLTRLTDPALISVLCENSESNEPLTIILEDADQCLISRQVDNLADVSTLLNLCDGILGSALNIRIVATSNAKLKDMDDAIKRKGRLLKHVHIPQLSKNELLKVYTRLSSKESLPSDCETLADVYAAAYDIK